MRSEVVKRVSEQPTTKNRMELVPKEWKSKPCRSCSLLMEKNAVREKGRKGD